MYDPRVGRWLSLDPLAAKYPFSSPYVFTLDNPVIYIDPNGKEVYIFGKDGSATTTALQKVTSLTLKYDAKTHQLTAMGEPQNDIDRALMDAIRDPNVKVGLYTTDAEWYDAKDGSGTYPIMIGAYEGSEVKADGTVETMQLFNLGQAQKVEAVLGEEAGRSAAHEIVESHIGGVDNPGGGFEGYESAHRKAESADPKLKDLNNYNDKNSKTGVTEIGIENGEKRVKLTDSTRQDKKFTKE